MIDFVGVSAIQVPEGNVVKITNATGEILWEKKASRLPNEYQEVEYLLSDGSQWINTKFVVSGEVLTNGLRAVSKIAILNTSGKGAMYKNSNPYFFIGVNGTKFYSGLGASYANSSITNDKEPHVLTLDSTEKTYTVDDTVATQYETTYKDGSGYLYLFKNYNGSSTLTARLYYTQLYYQEALVRDFVPCYRKTDNKPGMYDLVSGAFLVNSGTGDFTCGEDVV